MAATIHDDIEPWLAAALHDELSTAERVEFEQHLAGCAACRASLEEQKTMSRVIADTFNEARPDAGFEQRLLAGFRGRVPARSGGLLPFFAGLMQLRATQITAVAAVLLTLAQVGRWLTVDSRSGLGNEEMAVQAVAPPGSLGDLRRRLSGSEPATTHSKSYADAFTRAPIAGARPGTPGAAAPPTGVGSYAAPEEKSNRKDEASTERVAVTKSKVAPSEATAPDSQQPQEGKPDGEVVQQAMAYSEAPEPAAPAVSDANRKLIRNASVDLEIPAFDEAAQKITAFASEDGGYVATTSSEKQANGKLKGEVVVKVLPANLDTFLGKLRGLGELKNQTLGTEDVTKQYFDTDSRLKNARAMEQRLLDILKKKSEDINDLLQVEKEIGRVREEIEQMQGELKFMDAQVQFATVTITLAEKDMNIPAAFLLKERAQLALFAPEVEKIYGEIKALASPKVQITTATLNRDNSGRVSAQVSMLIAPEESDAVINHVKAMGRVENFQVQTERVAKGGEGMSQDAKTERDKVELNITISREEQELALQQTSLRIRTDGVSDRTKQLREFAEKQSGRVRSSSFARDPNGREYANVSLRVPMKNYGALMQSLNSLGKVEDVSVHREDRPGTQPDEASAPADLSIEVYSQGNIVSQESGILATLRHTLAQGVAALMWSVRMIGVALAFFAPWVLALLAVVWIVRRVRRSRRDRAQEQ
jgi:hypothetical protein